MKIEIMSRIHAIQYTYLPHTEKTIIISISEGLGNKPSFCIGSDIVDILYLFFDDVEEADLEINPMYKLMSTQDALAIKDFLEKHKDNIDKIIVHCYAGISRSSAVAVGICKYLDLDDLWIWKGLYAPNKWVLEVMNTTLQLGITKKDLHYRDFLNWNAWEECKFKDEVDIVLK